MIHPEVQGLGEPMQWVAGTYDDVPLRVRLAPVLLARLRDGDNIAPERLDALAELVTDKIQANEGRLAQPIPGGPYAMTLALDMAAWEQG